MQLDQLQLILDAAAAAGDGAMQVVVIWFAYKFAGLLVTFSLVGGLILGAYKIITGAIKGCSFVCKIEDETGYNFDSKTTRHKFLKFVRENWK